MPIQMRNIIGMPPNSNISDSIMRNSLPVLQITPGSPAQVNTLTTFVFKSKLTQYLTALENYGYTFEDLDVNFLKVAIIPDNFPSDTFTNEYSENFLQKMGDVASESIGQLAQMTGSRRGSDTLTQLGGAAGSALSGLGFGDAGSFIANGVKDSIGAAQKSVSGLNNSGVQGALKNMAGMADEKDRFSPDAIY